MKRKILIVILCFVMLASLGLTACAKPSDKLSDMTEVESVCSIDGKNAKSLVGAQGTQIDIKFATALYVNTLYLKEKTDNIESFQLVDITNGEKVFYEQDYINKERYCAFETILTSHIRLVVKLSNGDFNFKSIKAYYNGHNRDDFRSTAYVIASSLQEESQLDLGHFKSITDVILFGEADFDKNGDIFVNTSVLDKAYSLVRSAEQKLNKKYNIYLNFLFKGRDGYKGDWNSNMKAMAKDITNAMQGNMAKMVENINVAAAKYDGISFDWEYPMTKGDFDVYGEFLIELKAKTNKKIAIALAAWGIKFSKKYLDVIDVVELMTYDNADKRGNHSNFYDSCKRAIDYATSVGIDPQKIDLGIPAYGRPSDMAALWPSYSDEAAVLGKFGNRADGSFGGTDKPRYYNSFQMVYDKVAYSLQVGIGGVMVWHYSADASSASELSLFGAIEQSIFDRKSSNMVLVD